MRHSLINNKFADEKLWPADKPQYNSTPIKYYNSQKNNQLSICYAQYWYNFY